MLKTYIETVLSSWEALQFAVEQQTGGPESKSISIWLNEVTEQFFHDNEDLYADEVAHFLSAIMNQELNTLVDDGSDLQISEVLCRVYKSHKEGDTSAIEEILSKLPKNSCSEFKIESDGEEGVEMCHEVSNGISSLSLASGGPLAAQAAPPASSSPRDAEDDGWTMIKTGKRKK